MRFLQSRKFIRIHWLLLALLFIGAAWLAFPERNASAMLVDQSFSEPNLWVSGMTINDGWGPQHPRLLANVNDDSTKEVIGFGNDGVWLATFKPVDFSPNFVLADFGYNSGWRVEKHVRTAGDINNDQKDDIVGFGEAGVYRALSNGTGFGPVAFVVADFGYEQGWRVDRHVRLLADVNGDQQKDIVGFGEFATMVSWATGNGNFSEPQFVLNDFGFQQGWRINNHIRTTGDVNGDTRQDIIGFGDHGVWVALSVGNGFAAPQLVLADFAPFAGGWQVSMHPRMIVDINKDGYDDIVGFGNHGVWVAHSNAVGGFHQPQFVVGDFGYFSGWRVNKHPRFVADLNADGYLDIVGYGQDSVFRALGGPTGFTSVRGVLRTLVASEDPFSLNEPEKWAPRFVADVNANGMADLIAFRRDGIWVAESSDQPPPPPPNAPTDLKIVDTTKTSISISWKDNSDNERQFLVYFRKEGEQFQNTNRPKNTTSAKIEGLDAGTKYCFVVEAENVFGVSAPTEEVCGRTDEEIPPAPFGFDRIEVFNCHSEQRSVFVWTFDIATGVFKNHGSAPSLWNGSSCLIMGSQPLKVPLDNGHSFILIGVDPKADGCGSNDPTNPFCQRFKSTGAFPGMTGGPAWQQTMN